MVSINRLFKPYQPSQMSQDNYQQMIPPENCSNSIALFYQYHPMENNSSEPIILVPDSCVDIVFILDPNHPCVKAWGSVLKGTKLNVSPGLDYFGIRFLPGKSSPFLKNEDNLVEEEFVVTEFFQKQGHYLDKLASASSFAERVEIILNEWVLKTPKELNANQTLAQYVLADIVKYHGKIRIEDLSLKSGYSTRYIEKIFYRNIGISPKQFSRIVRFQHLLRRLVTLPNPLTHNLIEKHGYFDQAHLIHEFKEFSLLTPSQFMKINYKVDRI